MSSGTHHPVLTSAFYSVAMLGGLVVGFIAMLNFHIVVGLEDGYAASPGQVWSYSPFVTATDVVLLLGGVLLGFLGARRLHHRTS